MTKLLQSMLVVCALTIVSLVVFADDHDKDKMLKEHFEFTSDVMVGNTMVKKGYYLVKYNTETGTVKVIDENKGKKVIATAKAVMTMSEKDFARDEIITRETSGHPMLIGLRLGGQKEELTLSD